MHCSQYAWAHGNMTDALRSMHITHSSSSFVEPSSNAASILQMYISAHLCILSQTKYSAAPGLSQTPVRRFGTHCLIRCVIQPSSPNAFRQDLRTYLFLLDIERYERIRGVTVSHNRAIEIDIYLLSYLPQFHYSYWSLLHNECSNIIKQKIHTRN